MRTCALRSKMRDGKWKISIHHQILNVDARALISMCYHIEGIFLLSAFYPLIILYSCLSPSLIRMFNNIIAIRLLVIKPMLTPLTSKKVNDV